MRDGFQTLTFRTRWPPPFAIHFFFSGPSASYLLRDDIMEVSGAFFPEKLIWSWNMIHILKSSSWHQFCERTRQVSTVISRFMCSTAPSKHIQLLMGCIWVGLSEDYLTLAVEACKVVRSRPCGTSQIWAWEWWDRKVSIMSSDAVKRSHIIPLWMPVAYESVDLGKSQEYNDNLPSQEGYDDFQDVFETREKCMIRHQHMI